MFVLLSDKDVLQFVERLRYMAADLVENAHQQGVYALPLHRSTEYTEFHTSLREILDVDNIPGDQNRGGYEKSDSFLMYPHNSTLLPLDIRDLNEEEVLDERSEAMEAHIASAEMGKRESAVGATVMGNSDEIQKVEHFVVSEEAHCSEGGKSEAVPDMGVGDSAESTAGSVALNEDFEHILPTKCALCPIDVMDIDGGQQRDRPQGGVFAFVLESGEDSETER
ncbi:unnamed protein product, partial [Symbiodinium microadriaticum]